MPTDTPDQVVAVACSENALVLVTHDKDFKAIAKHLNVTQKATARLHRISLRCPEVLSAGRVMAAMEVIENEWLRLQEKDDGAALAIEIYERFIKIIR
jgi:predicted nuclease of predicted toxin-antitoxin system